MRHLLIVLVGVLFSTNATVAQSFTEYSGDVWLQKEQGVLKVSVELKPARKEGEIAEFLLNPAAQQLQINKQSIPLKYIFDRSGENPNEFIEGKKLQVSMPLTETEAPLTIQYLMPIEAVNYWSSDLEVEGLETGLYTAWLPIPDNNGDIKYNFKLHLPPSYKANGNGLMVQKGDVWELTSQGKQFDPVILMSPDLKVEKFPMGNSTLKVTHFGMEAKTLSRLSQDVADVKSLFTTEFGDLTGSGGDFQFVFVPRVGGSSYSRNGFAVVSKGGSYEGTFRTIAHEIGHFWWTGASPNTWEDWLNESFAEYAAVLAVGDKYGKDAEAKLLEKYKKSIEGLPAIWGISRNDSKATLLLYRKGPVLLNRLRAEIGGEGFSKFLHTLYRRQIRSTAVLLNLLEELQGKKVREAFESDLRS